MKLPLLLFGALGDMLPRQNRTIGKTAGLLFSDVLLIIGIAAGLLVVLALTIYFWMKLHRRHRRHITGGEKVYRDHHHQEDDAEMPAAEPQAINDEDANSDEESEPEEHHHHHHHHGRRRFKYRVRRRTHRSRNPTLAETGGLPPVKTQAPGKPF